MKAFEVKLDSREANDMLFGLFVSRRLLHIVQEIAEISSMVTWPNYFAYMHQPSKRLVVSQTIFCAVQSRICYEKRSPIFNSVYVAPTDDLLILLDLLVIVTTA